MIATCFNIFFGSNEIGCFQKPQAPICRGAIGSGVHVALGFLTLLGEALHGIEAHEEMAKGIVAIKGIVVLRTTVPWSHGHLSPELLVDAC